METVNNDRGEKMDRILHDSRKEMLKELFKDGRIKPMKFRELCGFLSVPRDEREDFNMILSELQSEGLIVCDTSGRFGLSNARIIEGTYSQTSRGFGFVMPDENSGDIFVTDTDNNGAIHGDRVSVSITREADTGGKKRAEGKIVKIIERKTTEIVGMISRKKNTCFVIPDNQHYIFDVYVPKEKSLNAVHGTKVICRIKNYGEHGKNPEGEVVSILGHINDPGVDILSIIKSYGIPYEMPEDVKEEIKGVSSYVTAEECFGRKDLRNLRTVTIDGEDAKDLDDAISLSKGNGNYLLGVHIADVANYVKENSALDREALNRGTSVYTTDRVVPMLPHELSNGICSLNQGQDRLALSCLMEFDSEGNILSHSIEETVINVDKRMNYHEVNNIINRLESADIEKYADYVDMFDLMFELSKKLRKKRFERGAVDFNTEECKIILDEKGRAIDVQPYDINDANGIIEDFMLAANETVAEEYFWMENPFVYRIHEEPDAIKIEELNEFLKNLKLKVHVGNELHSKEIQKLLEKIKGTDAEPVISRLTLRSMKQARYATECLGHFGLAARYYCHFTSPIRRYPDLQIHRIIKEQLHGGINDERIAHYNEILGEVSSKCSAAERRADEAERESDKMKKAEYMRKHIGEEFEGVISGITNWGMYVELSNTIEGLVRFENITNDFISVDKSGFSCRGERSKKVYSYGQKVKVQVAGADKFLRSIDFVLVDEE